VSIGLDHLGPGSPSSQDRGSKTISEPSRRFFYVERKLDADETWDAGSRLKRASGHARLRQPIALALDGDRRTLPLAPDGFADLVGLPVLADDVGLQPSGVAFHLLAVGDAIG